MTESAERRSGLGDERELGGSDDRSRCQLPGADATEGPQREAGSGSSEATELPAPARWLARKAWQDGDLPRTAFEFALYTDAHVVGGPHASGPFLLVNTLPADVVPRMAPAVALRVEGHRLHPAEPDDDLIAPAGSAAWTGLTIDGELAVLLSLTLGVRVRSGGLTRRFDGRDPRGVPVEYDHQAPLWAPPRRGAVLPGVAGRKVDLADAGDWLDRYGRLSEAAATCLLRAARGFRDAVWVAETDPELAWLLLVSALEAAACHHALADTDPCEVLDDALPDLVRLLRASGDPGLLDAAARQLAPLVKSTKRFNSFTRKYQPAPPEIRPIFGQVDWSRLRAAVSVVYEYRSARLHSGRPFPAPLCEPPLGGGDVPCEKPPGTGSFVGSLGSRSSWTAAELPMYLHTFVDVTRRTLLAWWRDLSETGPEAVGGRAVDGATDQIGAQP